MGETEGTSARFPGAQPAAPPANEAARVQALHDLALLDTLPEAAFDDIVQIASALCGVPIALVSLVDSERQWFKARVGLDAAETHRDLAFCAHAIQTPGELFEVPDATHDTRFARNPLVTGDPHIRFYAGVPLVDEAGHALGTLCVIDREPRRLDRVQAEALQALARRVMNEVQLRTTMSRLDAIHRTAEASRAITASIIESMPSAVVVVDMEGRPLINNAAAIAISGLRSEEFPADPAEWPEVYGVREIDGRVLHVDEVPLVRALHGETVRNRDLLIRNARRPQGTYVEANAQPVVDSTGQQVGATVVFTDITARRQQDAERERQRAALAASEARFRHMTDAAPHILWTATADGHIDFVNSSGLAYFGRTVEQLGGSGWLDSVHPDDLAVTVQRWQDALTHATDVEVQYRIRRHDGAWRWHIVRGVPERDAAGRAQRWFGVITDIEDLKQAQTTSEQALAALSHSERRYRFLTDAIPLQVWTADPDGHIDFVNAFAAEYFQRSSAEIVASGWIDLMHPDDAERVMQRWQHSVTHHEPYECEFRLRRADGVYCWTLARAKPQFGADGRVEKWFGTSIEIEAIKRAQQLAEDATRAKSSFLSSMSHEIRTPMNAIIGMTSILLDSELTPAQREPAEVIRASGDHLITVINDILDYSKIEAGKLDLEHSAFSVRDCIEGAIDLVATSAAGKGVEVGYLMAAGTPESVLGDVGRLRQVLLNLLSNAVKFTPGGGHVMVEAKAVTLDDGDGLAFSVTDSGIGIAADVLPTLFTPFMQGDASTTRRFGGTGLGLSISRRLVEAMGGDIHVSSVPGAGSVFAFHIRAAAAPTIGRLTPEPGVAALAGLRVMIVDDLELNRRILEHYVRAWRMVPHAFATPREALESIRRGDRYELALLDYHMPEMDGLDLAKALRAQRSEAELKLVILSSVSLDAPAPGVLSGALLKPIKPARLLDVIAPLLTRHTSGPSAAPATEMPHTLGLEHPLRVLVVEDNAVNQRVARLLLARMGYTADFAGNGEEALQAVARQTYDLVLMDVQMPVMDGLTATRALCRTYAPDARPRIVGMTANATEEDRRSCAQAGMDDYLAKPVRPQELAAALTRTPRRGQSSAGAAGEGDFSTEGYAELVRVYGDDGTAEIVEALKLDQDRHRRELDAALSGQDALLLRRVAHTLKSNCQMVGAAALGARWLALEQQAEPFTQAAHAAEARALMSRYEQLLQALDTAATRA